MYPVMLDITDKRVVVVGGGAVAERKVRALLQGGPVVVVVAPELTPGLEELGRAGDVSIIRRAWQQGDGADAVLVVAATDSRHVNRAVGEEARGASVPVNVADAPEECTVQLPAVHYDTGAGVVIGVSTLGASPRRARLIRDAIAKFLSTFTD